MKTVKISINKVPIILPLLLVYTLGCFPQKANKGIDREIHAITTGLIPKVVADSIDLPKYALTARMKFYKVPGVSIAVFQKGKIKWAKGFGMGDNQISKPVDTKTKFQAASISKAVTALAVLKLCEDKRIDLDRDVNEYLKSWKIPENEFTTTEKVTIRRLLNHTAGISVPGFTGYSRSANIPKTINILNGDGNTPKVIVESIPGEKFSYSGGGYVILQQLVEDLTAQPFDKYMQENLLKPLGMKNSTFNQSPSGNISLAHDNYGTPYPGGWFIMPELAPAGLWTTPSDLATFCIAIQKGYKGEPKAFISQKTIIQMLTPTNNWGLGVGIRGKGDDAFLFHGGKNKGFNNIIIDLFNKDFGIIIMTNGEQGGSLRDEIVRGAGQFYDVKIQPSPRRVKPVDFKAERWQEFAGKYKWKDNYFLELVVTENSIILNDLFDGKVNTFTNIGDNTFIDLNTGEEATLNKSDDSSLTIRYNNYDTFTKVE